MLNLKTAEEPIMLSILSGAVPILVSDAGVGKTSLIQQIAESLNYKFINIDANLLKEGEIGGLPVIKEINGKTVTTYAVHHVLNTISEWYNENPEQGIILFIDEFNRCEFTVQQELMNLILNREINGFKLPDTVKLAAAQNPSSLFSDFKDSDYQTVDMDPAQMDRFRWFMIECDVNVWIEWAVENDVEGEIIEFIASNNQALHQPDSAEDIFPTPRSWKRFSDTFKITKTMKLKPETLFAVAKGDLGSTTALQFTRFLKDTSNPLLKPEDIFKNGLDENKNVKQEILDKISSETKPRHMILVKNCINYVSQKNKPSKQIIIQLSQVIRTLPRDFGAVIINLVFNKYKPLHKKLTSLNEYLSYYLDIIPLISEN